MKKAIILLAVIGFVAWQVTYNDAVSNAMLALFLGGQLPFSQIVISPQVIIGITAAILFLLVFGLLMRVAPRSNRSSAGRYATTASSPIYKSVPEAMEDIHTVALAAPLLPTYSPFLRRRGNEWRIRRRVWLAHHMTVAREALRSWAVVSKLHAMRLHALSERRFEGIAHGYRENWLNRGAELIVKSREKLLLVGHSTQIKTVHLTRSSYHLTREVSIKVWRYASPYLWRLDGWLEQKTHTSVDHIKQYVRRHNDVIFFIDLWR